MCLNIKDNLINKKIMKKKKIKKMNVNNRGLGTIPKPALKALLFHYNYMNLVLM
jgi:hypothetical protein